IHGGTRAANKRLETRQGAQMTDPFQVVFRIDRFDVNPFRRVPDQTVSLPLQFLFIQCFPVCAGGGALAHIEPHSNSMISSSTARLAPASAVMRFTVSRRSARSTFSIFMASTVASGCPASTVSPCSTRMDVMTPGIGQSSIFDV